MLVEDETQLVERYIETATKSDIRNGFRALPPSFTAFAHPEGDRVIVILNGELDVASITILIDSILIDCFMGIASAVEEVVLDFAGLDFIDGSGLHAIAVIAQQVAAYGGSVSICSPRPQIQRLFELVDFKQIVTIES